MAILSIQPDETTGIDTYIDAGSPTTNFGSSGSLYSGTPANTRKTLIKFDLSSINPGWVINSVTLRLRCVEAGNSASSNLSIFRGLLNWTELEATWQQRSTGVPWAGGFGGASGLDYASSATDITSLAGAGAYYDWDVTNDVVNFVNGSQINYGWWLFHTSGDLFKRFTSSADSNDFDRPELIIDYTADDSILIIQPDETAGQDTYLAGPPTVDGFNYGTAVFIAAGVDTSRAHRGLIKFDVSTIPSQANIVSATVRLRLNQQTNSTSRNIQINRSLVEWFEGTKTGATPDGGEDASTWNHRNANGSISWGGAGGLAGTDHVTTPEDIAATSDPGTYISLDVTDNVQAFVDGSLDNYGWFLIETSGINGSRKVFDSSSSSTSEHRPQLIVVYNFLVEAGSDGTSTAEGTLSSIAHLRGTSSGQTTAQATISAVGYLVGNSEGSSEGSATLITNEFVSASAEGEATASGTMHAIGYMEGLSSNSSTPVGDIQGKISFSPGLSQNTATVIGDIQGEIEVEGSSTGSSSASGEMTGGGFIDGSTDGIATVVGIGYAKATGKATPQNCIPLPLFHITDGSYKNNGQQNILDLLSDRNGYRLNNWEPTVIQFKDGGRWANSPTAQGRRLKGYVFDNAIEVIDLNLVSPDQDRAVQFVHELWQFQQAVADYWASAWSNLPIYLVSRAARETNTRYAIIHQISCPQLRNIYTQPFFDEKQAAFDTLTLRVERGHWLSTPPGTFDCVAISSFRSWTVAGWQTGS